MVRAKKSMRKIKDKNQNKKISRKKINNWLYWSPRVLTILFILFISLFSLDVFDSANNYTFWETVVALLMHNIPSFILIIFLIFAWKWELVGAIGFALFAIWYMGLMVMNSFREGFQWYYLAWSVQISGPAFVIAFLWWMNWKRKR